MEIRPWKAYRGVACALILVLLAVCENEGLRFGYRNSPTFTNWVRSHWHFVESSLRLLRDCEWILAAYFFSGLRSVREFRSETGLRDRWTPPGWLFACTAIGLGLLQLYAVHRGVSTENPSTANYYRAGEAYWSFFVVYATLVAPFFEETVLRGFLYRAFRGSWGVVPSTALVLSVMIYFHWGLVKESLVTLLLLIAGGSILCAIREYTGNTWNCVVFHAAYNATVIRQWPVLILMVVVLLLLERRGKGEDVSACDPQNIATDPPSLGKVSKAGEGAEAPVVRDCLTLL